ncbi:MAG: hypothetical protein AAFN77_20760 [Planctomycetota bacterium]
MEEYQPLVTKTPWTGEVIDQVYLPPEKEIYARAAEIRNQRPLDRDSGPKMPTTVFDEVVELARESSPCIGTRRG